MPGTHISKFADKLKRQHVLFDTNVISHAIAHQMDGHFNELFFCLKEQDCAPIITEMIEYELLQGALLPAHKSAKKKFLDQLGGARIPITQETWSTAIEIGQIYTRNSLKNYRIVDTCLSAHLKQYQKNLVLLTSNLRDFPLCIHERIGVHTIDMGAEIVTYGFLRIDKAKYANEQKRNSLVGKQIKSTLQ